MKLVKTSWAYIFLTEDPGESDPVAKLYNCAPKHFFFHFRLDRFLAKSCSASAGQSSVAVDCFKFDLFSHFFCM